MNVLRKIIGKTKIDKKPTNQRILQYPTYERVGGKSKRLGRTCNKNGC